MEDPDSFAKKTSHGFDYLEEDSKISSVQSVTSDE
jgi:hypothetical protein